MDEKTLISLIEKVRNGFSVERTNIELKRRWWDLQKIPDTEEFYKDICAMANTQGGDSYILLGVDESGKLYNAPIPDDEANIQSKHKDAIEPRIKIILNEFQVEGKTISVITIPHSANRPHVIKKHVEVRNWIPVRFGSAILSASRSDLDEMYGERDRSAASDLHVRLFEDKVRWGHYPAYGGCCFLVRLSVDNYSGGAPDYIVKAELRQSGENMWRSNHFMFEGHELNQELQIKAHERKQGLQLYLSHHQPSSEEECPLPQISESDLRLNLYARSQTQIMINIKRNWLIEK